MRVVVASDHAGYDLKENIREYLSELGIPAEDLGTSSASEGVDYTDYAAAVADRVRLGKADRGILVCSTGVGVCITANKIPGIRAAVAWHPEIARLSRAHNDANVLCLSGKFTEPKLARELLKIWLVTPFDGGRHQRRVDKIAILEGQNSQA